MEKLAEKTTHVVVLFEKDTIKSGKRIIDLIPRSWLSCSDGVIYCKYPGKARYSVINQWVEDMIDPDPRWPKHCVTLLKEGVGIEQGKRRLERAYTQVEVESSDIEKRFGENQLAVLSDGAIEDELNNVSITITDRSSLVTRTDKESSDVHPATPADKEPLNGSTRNEKETSPNHPPSSITEETLVNALRDVLPQMEDRIVKRVDGAKRSIQYDLNAKMDQLKTTAAFNQPLRNRNIAADRETLGTAFPMKTLEDFLLFETALEDEEKKKALVNQIIRYRFLYIQ